MYRVVMMVVIGSIFSAFTLTGDTPVPADDVRELRGYKVRTGNASFNDFNLWVITNGQSFDQVFVSDSSMTTNPDFDKELVVAASIETKSAAYKVKFKKVLVKKDELNIYFTAIREKRKEDHEGQVSMLSLSKTRNLKKVNFYHDNILVRSVPIVIVY